MGLFLTQHVCCDWTRHALHGFFTDLRERIVVAVEAGTTHLAVA